MIPNRIRIDFITFQINYYRLKRLIDRIILFKNIHYCSKNVNIEVQSKIAKLTY
jgi:hypothetical protein